MEVLVTICCRSGSKGVPKKNTRILCGKPLVQWTINSALEWEIKGEVPITIVVSTDDAEVRRIALQNNLFVIDRAPELASDTAGKISVIRDAWRQMEYRVSRCFDIILDLDVCNPLRRIQDIDAVYQRMVADRPLTMFSVTRARRNPYFNQWPLVPSEGGGIPLSRQACYTVYDLNCCIYAYSRDFMLSGAHHPITDKSLPYVMPDWSAFDIDTELDFFLVEKLTEKYANEMGMA